MVAHRAKVRATAWVGPERRDLCQLVVDLAALVLELDVAAGCFDREENRDPGRQ